MKNIKKIIYIILLGMILQSCVLLQKILGENQPEFKVQSVQLDAVSWNGITIKINSILYNYYKFGLPESRLNLNIKINGQTLSGYRSSPFQVAAESSVLIPIYLKLKFQDIAKMIKDFPDQKVIRLTLEGGSEFLLNIAGISQKIHVPFRIEKTIPAFFPSIELKDVSLHIQKTKFQNLLTGDVKLNVHIELLVKNKGGTPFRLTQKNMAFALNQEKIITVDLRPSQNITIEQLITLDTQINLSKSLQSLWKAIISRNRLLYSLNGNLQFNFDGVDFQKYELPIQFRGNVLLNKQ